MAFKFIVNQNPLQVEFEAGSIREGLSVLEGEEAALHAFFVTAAKLAHTHGAPVATSETTITADTAGGTAPEATDADGKPKRTRRTKEQMAADAARVAAATAPAPMAIPGAQTAAPPPPPLASAPPTIPAAPTFAPPPVVPGGALASAPASAVAAPIPPAPASTAFVAAPLPDLQVPDFLVHPGPQTITTTAPLPSLPNAPLPASLSPNVPLDIGKGAAEILAELRRRSAGNPDTEQQCADWVASFKTADGTSNLILAPGAKFNEIADVLPFCKNDTLAMLVGALGVTVA